MIYLTFARLRKKGIKFLVPLFVLFVVLPVMGLIFRRHYADSPEQFLRVIVTQLHVWVPVFSSWWSLVLFHDFFESEGNELLYLYHKPVFFLQVQYLAILLYAVGIFLFFLVFQIIAPIDSFALPQLIAESFAISSLTYFLCFLLLNTGAAFLVPVAYSIYINLFDSLNLLSFLSIFPENSFMTSENVKLIVYCCAAAVIFSFGGFVCSKYRRKYK